MYKNVRLWLHSSANIQLAGKLHVRQMFVKEADGIVSYLKPNMESVGEYIAKVLGTTLLCLFLPIMLIFYLLCYAAVLKF